MIVNKLSIVSFSGSFTERLEKAYEFLRNTDLASLPAGRVPIDGDALFANVQEYTTRPAGTIPFENHERYADVQYIVSGHELIYVTGKEHIGPVSVPYDEEGDITFYNGSTAPHHVLDLSPGESAVFFPDDYHRTQCSVDPEHPVSVKKVIVKVKL